MEALRKGEEEGVAVDPLNVDDVLVERAKAFAREEQLKVG